MPRLKLKQLAGPGSDKSGYGLKLDASGVAIDYFDLADVGNKGPLGYYATVYTVANEQAKNNIDTTKIHPGDQVYVMDDGAGMWAQYIASSVSSDTTPVVSWTLMSSQTSASASGTAKTISVPLTYQSSSTILLTSIVPYTRVLEISIDVLTPFDQTSSVTFGDDSNNIRLADNSNLDLSSVGTYIITPSTQYTGTSNTDIKAYFSVGSATSGSATITISCV